MAKWTNQPCRTLTVRIFDAKVNKSWSGSTISLMEYNAGIGPFKKAVIKIEDPSDVRYIRTALEEIESYWKYRLEGK